MNSFNTDEDTLKLLRKYANVRVEVHTFCQSKYPRISKESMMPIVKNVTNNDLEGLVSTYRCYKILFIVGNWSICHLLYCKR